MGYIYSYWTAALADFLTDIVTCLVRFWAGKNYLYFTDEVSNGLFSHLCFAGGDESRPAGDVAVYCICVWGVHQRAWSPASHLQAGEGLRQQLKGIPRHVTPDTSGATVTDNSGADVIQPAEGCEDLGLVE